MAETAHQVVELKELDERLKVFMEAAEAALPGLPATLSSLESDFGSASTTFTEAATLMSTGWKDDDGKKEMGVVSLMADATKRLQTNGVGNTLTTLVSKIVKSREVNEMQL